MDGASSMDRDVDRGGLRPRAIEILFRSAAEFTVFPVGPACRTIDIIVAAIVAVVDEVGPGGDLLAADEAAALFAAACVVANGRAERTADQGAFEIVV